MITLHPTFKKTAEGFVPMINVRGDKGRMIGSRTPQGAAREFRTFTNSLAAEIEARVISLRVAVRCPFVKVA